MLSQGCGQPTAAVATATGHPVKVASPENQGRDQSTAAGATTTGGPVRVAVNPTQ